jgi:hypothetical protein
VSFFCWGGGISCLCFLLVCVCYASYASFVRWSEEESAGGGRLRRSGSKRRGGTFLDAVTRAIEKCDIRSKNAYLDSKGTQQKQIRNILKDQIDSLLTVVAKVTVNDLSGGLTRINCFLWDTLFDVLTRYTECTGQSVHSVYLNPSGEQITDPHLHKISEYIANEQNECTISIMHSDNSILRCGGNCPDCGDGQLKATQPWDTFCRTTTGKCNQCSFVTDKLYE